MKKIHSVFFITSISKICIALILISIVTSEKTFSQKKENYKVDEIFANENSMHIEHNSFILDTLKIKTSTKKTFVMKKNPWKAVAYSAILPGSGQFYNESYWKIPIIAGLGGYFGYEIVKNNNKFLDYKNQFINSQTQQNPSGDERLKTLREFYRDQRDDFIIYSVILYVVNLIDAYVDAQLYDFDVSDKIKLGILKKDKLLKLSFNF